MTKRQHIPLVIQVREKSCFCDAYINNNAMSQCENIANGYVSKWKRKEIIRSPPYEEDDNDIDIHNLMYSVDYESFSSLVVPGVFYLFKHVIHFYYLIIFIFIYIKSIMFLYIYR